MCPFSSLYLSSVVVCIGTSGISSACIRGKKRFPEWNFDMRIVKFKGMSKTGNKHSSCILKGKICVQMKKYVLINTISHFITHILSTLISLKLLDWQFQIDTENLVWLKSHPPCSIHPPSIMLGWIPEWQLSFAQFWYSKIHHQNFQTLSQCLRWSPDQVEQNPLRLNQRTYPKEIQIWKQGRQETKWYGALSRDLLHFIPWTVQHDSLFGW